MSLEGVEIDGSTDRLAGLKVPCEEAPNCSEVHLCGVCLALCGDQFGPTPWAPLPALPALPACGGADGGGGRRRRGEAGGGGGRGEGGGGGEARSEGGGPALLCPATATGPIPWGPTQVPYEAHPTHTAEMDFDDPQFLAFSHGTFSPARRSVEPSISTPSRPMCKSSQPQTFSQD
jgi:hypothetical protein